MGWGAESTRAAQVSDEAFDRKFVKAFDRLPAAEQEALIERLWKVALVSPILLRREKESVIAGKVEGAR
ncbi:hypothetical protein [Saccharopolyspora sp. 6V]|uniref:hypothetical protein n=1 Tax=Saccharopolyspora sp. 6V TaxID=2877239 RepID=UPI001CD5F0AF|nr:hypothetical protein [Saccharopolyspora sp. 6V]MCA1191630.1 hypothetical protein [Saccharopolyspora sp. 6V]